jgi:ATP-dependent RNA/DNA helicase IGHMBP2
VDGWLATLAAALDGERAVAAQAWEAASRQPQSAWTATGFAWPPARVVDVLPGRRTRLRVRAAGLHDAIGAGDPIWILPDRVSGTVVWVEGGEAEVAADDDPPAGWEGRASVTVTQRFDPTTWDRYRAGLVRAARHPTPLGAVLLGADPGPPLASVALPPWPALAPAQRTAGWAALTAPRVAAVHGPPGTGKTRLIGALLRHAVDTGDRPWALADSNAAADLLAVAADREGLTVVRLGQPARMTAAVAAWTVEARLAEGPFAAALARIDQEIRRAAQSAAWSERRQLLVARDALVEQARSQLVARTQVVVATLATMAREAARWPPPTTAVVDEATQAIEPAVWAVVPHVQRLVLVGDPHQLGPVIRQQGNLLARSLLQRWVASGGAAPMLEEQRRMPTEIQRLVASVYGPRYHPHPSNADRCLADLPGVDTTPDTAARALWIDTAGSPAAEVRDPLTGSLWEPVELQVVAMVVARWRAAGVAASSIAVLSPYSAQVARLSALPALAGVEVATISSFQGREQEAIVVSFVRSNDEGQLGFVDDRARLVVALTRARRALRLVGDSATLTRAPLFAEVWEALASSGAVCSVWEPPWSEAVDAAG